MVCGLHIFQRFIWKPIQYQLHIIVKREARLDQIYKTDLNELFSYQRKGEKLEEKEKVIEIEIERLRDFKEHPFHVKDDKEMSLLKESIKNYGILSPLIVRPVLDGVYEIVSGHRRKYAAQQLGYKDILSITVGANETSKFWLGMLNDLKDRGVQDVLFFCVDGLPGFKDAIQAVFPQAQIQRCVIHMLRNSFKYVNYNDLKKFSADFKAVYNAPNESAALSELETIKEKWGKKYPYAISNWENNWEDVSSFFQFSEDIRRIMYTTNIIEGLNRQYRKVTKTKSVFPSDTALEKMLFLASRNVTKKWTQRYRNWDQVLNQLIILYDERLTAYL